MALTLPGSASAQQPAERAVAAARADPRIARALPPGALSEVHRHPRDRWRVAFFGPDRRKVAEAIVAGETHRVLEAWTGVRAVWPMARGYEGAFGRSAASLPVWLALLAALALPFLRRPWRLLHLDLAALASLSVSFALFSASQLEASVPLAYPPLLYLLVRLVLLARRPPSPRGLRLRLGARGLLFGIAVLALLRIALQLWSSNVIDVGYAGVVGADRIAAGADLYGAFGDDNPHGDTYGPLLYLAYVPFELLWPWSGTWDALPAGHAAAATFDALCAAGLYLAGRRRGHTTGLLLAYVWLACPFTLLAANSGASDALVGLLVLAAVALPAVRGGLAAAAGMTKLAPFALLPLLVRTRRSALGAAAVVAALLGLVVALDGGLGDLWERTVGFQAGRDSPFSVWGLYDLPALPAQIAAVVLVAVLARRHRDLAAACAAALIAVQLAAPHWFHLYVPWFLPVALLALTSGYVVSSGRRTGSIAAARPVPSQRIRTPISQGSSSALS